MNGWRDTTWLIVAWTVAWALLLALTAWQAGSIPDADWPRDVRLFMLLWIVGVDVLSAAWFVTRSRHPGAGGRS
jgi:hypothetical protein